MELLSVLTNRETEKVKRGHRTNLNISNCDRAASNLGLKNYKGICRAMEVGY